MIESPFRTLLVFFYTLFDVIEKISVILSPYQMMTEARPARSSSLEEDPDYLLFLENETVSDELEIELIEVNIES